MEISVPIGAVASGVKNWLEKSLLFETYADSHRQYLNRLGFGGSWTSLEGVIEVSVDCPTVLDHDRALMPQLAIRATNANARILQLKILVEAVHSGLSFQDVVEVYDVSASAITFVKLPSIPLRTFQLTDDARLIFSFDRLYASIIPQDASAGLKEMNRKQIYSQSNMDLLNDRFVERWGMYWNMRAIDAKIESWKKGLWVRLVARKPPYTVGTRRPVGEIIFTVLIGGPAYWVCSRGFVARACFWLPVFAKKLMKLIGRRS